MNRSPCTTRLSHRLLESARPTLSPERLLEPPPNILTPERAAARGLAVQGQVTEQVHLHEDTPFVGGIRLKEEQRGGVTVTTVKLDVAYTDIINRNGRYYPRSCYEAANARAASDLADGGLYSLMDHPEWWEPLRGSLNKVCIKIEELGIEDREVEWPLGSGQTRSMGVVTAKGIIVDTQVGQDVKALLKAGVRVGVSTNGWASTEWVPAKELDPNYYDPEELIPVTQDDFVYFSIDVVSDPSNLGGRARTETRRPPTPPASAPDTQPTKEGIMHELLQALLEKYPGKTLDQIKAAHNAEYLAALEQIVQESAPAPAGEDTAPAAATPAVAPAPVPVAVAEPPAPLPSVDYNQSTVSMEHYRALESRVVQLTSRNSELQEQLRNQTRDTIALTALEAANLPRNGTFEQDGVTIDLDASFRQDVIAVARGAASDQAATEAVNRKITERRAMSGGRQQEGRRPTAFDYLNRQGNPGPSLGANNTGGEKSRQVEGYAPLSNAFREIL